METTVKIIIEYDQLTGALKINGPSQQLLCFGVLELAKQGFQKHFDEVAKNNKVLVPSFSLPPRQQGA
jgi:hypothetical protein